MVRFVWTEDSIAEEAKKRKIDIPSTHWYYVIDNSIHENMEMHVLKLWGWDTSDGVHYEMLKAKELGIRVKYIDSTWAYTTPSYLERMTTDDVERVACTVEYILTDASDDYMIDYGLPTTESMHVS